MHKKAVISVSGTVQGVGLRPFVHRTAINFGITGFVKNLGDAGVLISAEGREKDIERFIEYLKKDSPGNIDKLSVKWSSIKKRTKTFRIVGSGGTGLGGSVVPDYGICDDCIKEVRSPQNRRFRYPLTTCTICGPRYSVLREMPLDRKNTSFRSFPLCDDCAREYRDPEDRRFFAQTIACDRCGPNYFILDKRGKSINDPVGSAIRLLKEDKILAIKGVGGMHLACLASSDRPVRRLRQRLSRNQQPYAVMATLSKTREFAEVSSLEKRLLAGRERPIVLLNKKKVFPLSDHISPGLHNVGVMLPYTALHLLLFSGIDDALVMTSANRHGEPMTISNEEMMGQGAADYFLLHDLDIVNRCDDSVIKVVGNKPSFIRRSRGYAPSPIPLRNVSNRTILALGAEESLTFCLVKGGNAYLSQHIGNTSRMSTQEYLEESVERFLKIFKAKPDAIACDLHPLFYTTKYAMRLSRRFNADLMQVQHHQSHLFSLAAEHSLDELVAICCDGTGYGLDGNAWGGEVFSLKEGRVDRVGHLKEQMMPGGDLAAKYPARMVAGVLYPEYEEKELRNILGCLYFPYGKKEIPVVLKQLERGINVPKTTSAGRVLDAVSVLLGLCTHRDYEAEPAMKLESAGLLGKEISFPDLVTKGNIDSTRLLRTIVELRGKKRAEDLAYTAQKKMGEAFAEIALDAAKQRRIGSIGFSGGVAYNSLISKAIEDRLKEDGFVLLRNNLVPCGDGGVSYGQAACAARP